MIVASAGVTASAQAPTPPADQDGQTHLGMALFELAMSMGIPAAYYWRTSEHQAVDFELGNDWASWKTKLFSTDKLRFDTNPFDVNAFHHPVAGVVDYHIIRTNGYSPLVATAVAYGKGVVWEYVVEYREDPSINDLIFNGAGGLAIGEPLYRIGQLWRGSRVTARDRVKTALFSPFDAFHDSYRKPTRWMRPSVWSSIDLAGGVIERAVDHATRTEVLGLLDIDVVANRAFAEGGAYHDRIKAGEWSRLRVVGRLGDTNGVVNLSSWQLRSQTAIFGRYRQTADGDGRLLALGAAFTYRNDELSSGRERDRFAIAHLIGPQIQLSRRRAGYEVRWDAAAYADFALVEALVFSPDPPFPKPPPYFTALQSDGYIDAIGVTAATRLRVLAGPWRAELELDAHLLRQVVNHDRDPDGNGSSSEGAIPAAVNPAVTAVGIDEQRAMWRLQFGYQPGEWGLALITEGAKRRSSWKEQTREISDVSIGAMIQLAY